MHRFFIDKAQIDGNITFIEGEDNDHIQKVLRLHTGEVIELCDSQGMDYTAEITSMEKKRVNLRIIDRTPTYTEPSLKVILYQGMPKGQKFELIIQKCVELGISRIVPVLTDRTVVKFDGLKDTNNKLARWNRISMEAAKQSKRGIIPEVSEPAAFAKAVDNAASSLKLILWEEERSAGLREILSDSGSWSCNSIDIMIGPEGGLDKAEVDYAISRGWQSVTIGPRILRTETAGMSVLSAIMYQMEEMEWKKQP